MPGFLRLRRSHGRLLLVLASSAVSLADFAARVGSSGAYCPPESCTPSGLIGGDVLASGYVDCVQDDGRFGDVNAHEPFEWFDVDFADFVSVFSTLTWDAGRRGRRYAAHTKAPSSAGHRPSILHVGCGNSVLGEQLYDMGYTAIANVDIREAAIKQMRSRNSERRPGMSWHCADARRMRAFNDGSFDIVLDRGTLDHFVAADAEPKAYFEEIARVLLPGGVFLCMSVGLTSRIPGWGANAAFGALSVEAIANLTSRSRGAGAYLIYAFRRRQDE